MLAKSLLNLSTLKPFELLFTVLLTYEHLELIRCMLYFQSHLIQVQLPAKQVGKIDSFLQYTKPELYTYLTFHKKKQKKDEFVSLKGSGGQNSCQGKLIKLTVLAKEYSLVNGHSENSQNSSISN